LPLGVFHRACEPDFSSQNSKRLTSEATMFIVSQTANAATAIADVAEGFTNSPDVLSQAHTKENRVPRNGKPAGAIFICGTVS
jgi:hypothetical protein